METPARELPDYKTSFLKKHKKLIVFTALFFIVILISVISTRTITTEDESQTTPSPKQTTEKVTIPSKSPTRTILAEPFLLNVISGSKTNITDYAWNENVLLYSTNNGIFDAKNNELIVSKNITYLNFGEKAFAVFKSLDGWFVFDPYTKQQLKTNIQGSGAKINQDGKLIASISENTLYLHNTESNETKSVNSDSKVSQYKWANQSNNLAVYAESGNFTLYDEFLTAQKSFQVGSHTFLDISPNANLLVFTLNNNLKIFDLETEQIVLETSFDEKSELSGNWINENDFILVETNSNNPIGRVNNNLWKINMSGNITFLADTKPILRKIQTQTEFKTDSSTSALPLIENNSKLWILGLKTSQLPVYDENGLSFFKMPTQRQAE